MNPIQTTPVPNVLFDIFLRDLKGCELKVLLVIIRQTLGWVDKQTGKGRKNRDWISTSQLERKAGTSRRAISSALAGLVHSGLISISDDGGNILNGSSERKGKIRLYYQLNLLSISPVDKVGISVLKPALIAQANAEIAMDISKNVQDLAQKMLITKQNLPN
ncbi:MAG: replication protein [Bacteroidota bacterium]|nr:replication protein [Bacteroidota bacterium]